MMCCGLQLLPGHRHCAFCRRTIALIRARLCVACTAPVDDGDTERVQGRCAECREERVEVSRATARLLVLASRARYRARLAA